jgi:hypothetical protein
MEVLKFNEYKNSVDLATEFLYLIGSKINENNSINDIFNNPIFDDYYIKTWPISNSDFQEIVDLQNNNQ